MSTKNIYQKMSDVMRQARYVQKTGKNNFHKYSYATEADYINTIRPELLKNGLIVTSSLLLQWREGDITNVQMEFTIVNVDDPKETIKVNCNGAGQDKGDKGVYKAITGAKKYFLANQFLIETGDDAEKDGADDASSAETPAAPSTDTPGPARATAETLAQANVPVAETKPKRSTFRRVGQAPLAAKTPTDTGNDLGL